MKTLDIVKLDAMTQERRSAAHYELTFGKLIGLLAAMFLLKAQSSK